MLADCGHKCERKYLVDGIFYCGKCFNKLHPNAWFCSSCNEYHDTDLYTKYELDYSRLTVCQFRSYKVILCHHCNNAFSGAFVQAHPCQRREGWLCPECTCKYYNTAKTKVNGYYFTPRMAYYDGNKRTIDGTNFKGCGIELEVDNGGESDDMSSEVVQELDDKVYCKHDGSLSNGFEIVTYPHTLDSILNLNWENTFKDLINHGYRSHDPNTCGLHMHFSRTLFTDDQIKYLLYFIEKHWDDLIAFSRRDASHASRWASKYMSSPNFTMADIDRVFACFNKSSSHSLRYHALNLINKSTIEFRLMRGTLNYNTFRATVNFLCTLVKNVVNINNDNKDDLNVWLAGLEPNTISYMTKRNCFGYSNHRKQSKESDLWG